MMVTHCGMGIVAADERTVRARVSRLGEEWGVDVEIARDGMAKVLR